MDKKNEKNKIEINNEYIEPKEQEEEIPQESEKDKKGTEIEVTEETSSGSLEFLTEEVERLKKERDEYILKNRAEIFNLRKNIESEVNLSKLFTLEKLFRAIISFLSSLENNAIFGLKSLNNDKVNEFLVGTEIIIETLWTNLFSQGLKKIQPIVGIDKWNSFYHEFVSRINNDDLPENFSKDLPRDVIIEVVEEGYVFQDRVIKSAKVKLSSGKLE